MSKLIALSSKLPGNEDINGLDSLHDSLVENDQQVICAIVWFDVPTSVKDNEAKTVRPTLRIRRVEPFGSAEKVPSAVIDLAAQLMEARTGRVALPFTQLEGREDHVTLSNVGDAVDGADQ